MLILLLLLLVVGFVLSVFFWIGTLWLQGYIYSEPTTGLPWRTPAAGGALMVFLAVWCLLDYRLATPDVQDLPLDALWSFSPTEYYPAKPWPRFWSVKQGRETLYVRRLTGPIAGAEYVDPETNRPWSREANGLVEAVVIEDNGQKVRFNLNLPGGKFKPGESARFVEDGGRQTLTEDELRQGQMSRFRIGILIGNILLNVLFFALWFVCIWLLLRFQWSHALGLAVVFWLIIMLTIFPMLLVQTKKAAQQRAAPAKVSMMQMPSA